MDTDRRGFIKILGAGSTGLLTTGAPLAANSSQEKLIGNIDTHVFKDSQLETDVLVAGGGMAGVCAAIAAARNGAKVILIQNRSRLGGNGSSEIRMHILGANNHTMTQNWRETGIIEELKLTEAATNPQRSFEMWDLVMYDKVISEPNITLLLDTAVIGTTVSFDKIVKVDAISPLLEETYTIKAKHVIDCTGDASLAAAAGAKYMRGREGKQVFGESLAPDQTDNKTMGNSIMFFAKQHDGPMSFEKPAWAKTYTQKDFKHRRIGSYEYGYWWIEWGGELDTIHDNRQIRQELLSIVMGVWDYIKNSGEHPDSTNWALDWVGMIPGKRESRRVTGDHIMIQQEMEAQEMYHDRVSYGGWPMDDHPPEGMDRTDQSPYRSIKFEKPYNIPLKSLYSTNIKNLWMAGRNISASHVAFSSTRVMATCAAIGQAAGTAAAFSVKYNLSNNGIVKDVDLLQKFQQKLLFDDQSLLNIQNTDPLDLAKNATISASAETSTGRAVSIIDGWNRDVLDGQTHQWQAPIEGKPQWIELDWKDKVEISFIQITFDSGLNRLLYLTGQDNQYKKQIRGPQPETVKDFDIQYYANNQWYDLEQVRNNYLRLRRFTFKPIKLEKIKIQVHNTQGDNLARIFEVRCYA